MCTSFIKVTDDNCFIAMNFDNDGMKYRINSRKKDWFIVYVEIGGLIAPCFGVHKSGIFFNNLMVNDCEKGKYRRGKGVVHTTRFLNDFISGKIHIDDLNQYLKEIEIVNVPNFSTHNMMCDDKNNVWIIEPGRGNLYSLLKPNEFKLMTNFSILDDNPSSCERFRIADEYLTKADDMCVEKAFEILNITKQSEGNWITDFSMVYDKANKSVYFCKNRDFENIEEYRFQ